MLIDTLRAASRARFQAVDRGNLTRVADDGRRTIMNTSPAPCYELRYTSLFNEGRGLSFPCDGQGHVDLDALSDRARQNYLYARAVVGREFAVPSVMARATH